MAIRCKLFIGSELQHIGAKKGLPPHLNVPVHFERWNIVTGNCTSLGKKVSVYQDDIILGGITELHIIHNITDFLVTCVAHRNSNNEQKNAIFLGSEVIIDSLPISFCELSSTAT